MSRPDHAVGPLRRSAERRRGPRGHRPKAFLDQRPARFDRIEWIGQQGRDLRDPPRVTDRAVGRPRRRGPLRIAAPMVIPFASAPAPPTPPDGKIKRAVEYQR